MTGEGSGHKPAFVGYLGRNMVDAVAVGEIFSSPPAQAFYDAFIAADGGVGVACLYGNYAGDNMNVKMARELAKEDGIKVMTVFISITTLKNQSIDNKISRKMPCNNLIYRFNSSHGTSH